MEEKEEIEGVLSLTSKEYFKRFASVYPKNVFSEYDT